MFVFSSKRYWLTTWVGIIAIGSTLAGGMVAQEDSVDFVPSSAMAAVFLQPKDALMQPGMELLPREIITAFGQKELGFDPCKITRVVALVETIRNLENPPQFGLFVEFDSPQKLSDKLINQMQMTQGEMNGRPIYRGQSEFGESLYSYNDRSFILGNEAFISKMLSSRGAKSGLLEQIAQSPPDGHLDIYVAVEPVRALIKQQLPPADRLPPPLADFLRLPDLVDSISLNESFAPGGKNRLQIVATDDQAAGEIRSILDRGLETAKQLIMANMANEMKDEDPTLRVAMNAYIDRIANFIQAQFQPQVAGKRVVLDFGGGEADQLANIGTIGVLVGLLLPAVQQAREAARRTQAANQLRQFALAALNYESVHQEFPAQASFSEDGKPLLSWRVHLLPFLDQVALYHKFKLEEPWDSPHNIKLLDEMPEVFRGINSTHTNKTVFLGWEGEGTMFDGSKPTKIRDIADGTSNTIFFIEVNDEAAVEWTRPADYRWKKENPIWGLQNNRPGGFQAAFVDGSVRFISLDADWDALKNATLKADGNPIDRNWSSR